ncbi:E-selectin-like [Cyclopterus lumpus]|uniref:E-selectin-like n=1 Tax=Cyclopterus lumpus TaxID=8103 RepID=UPI001486B407|nr:E-selectin-like [Cyclopterus lumpus]
MEMCFGLLQTRGPKTSWISLIFLCSLLCTWTSVECWSYFYSNTNNMSWPQARAWCQEHYTDMVAIQNQEEIGHLNSWLPKKRTYYWIGIRKVEHVWTWVGTGKALTAEATNWAKGEPNNGKGVKRTGVKEDCVEMYIKSDSQPGKWNDERCEKLKTALCYTAACKDDSCRYGECVETINSHECACFEGFYGEKCEQVVQCNMEEVTVPYKGSVNCTHMYGNFSYDSSCQYSCEEGYQLSVSRPLKCNASQQWSERPPSCELVQCQVLSSPAGGSMKCSDPLGNSSYQSTCVFTCDEGHVLAGSPSNTLQCEASGIWNASQPLCLAVQCPSLQQLDNGFVSCGDDADVMFSYGNTCSFSCGPGYHLVGPSKAACTSAAVWSDRKPRCEAITCQNPEAGAHLVTQCSRPLTKLWPNSTCSFSCEAGFELQGAPSTQCSEGGQWSEAVPTCKAIGCPAPEIPTSAQISCSPPLSSPASTVTPHPLGTVCIFSCDEGHELQGALSMECANPGQWTSAPPNCTAVRCPLLEAPENGHINCSNSGFVSRGVDADVMFSYGNTCSFSCGPGYHLVGPSKAACTSAAVWSDRKPRCEAITCQNPEAGAHLVTQCSRPLTKLWPNSTCSFSCEAGFELQGAPSTQCSEGGQWSEAVPTCKAIGCPAPEIPTSAQISCSPPLSSPASTVTPHPLGTVCIFSCDEGHELQGALSMECANPGQWTSAPPNCAAVRCPLLEAPENGHINCSNSEPVLNSQCSFTCNQDYSLDGHELLTCDRHGNWTSGQKPTCQAPPSPVIAIASGVATGGALLSGLSLAVWILKRLKQRATKFELNSNSDIEAPPQVYKSSIDSLI